MEHGYTYKETLTASQRVNWRVEDIIGGDRSLDFSKAFLPEALARTGGTSFLSPREQLVLNQIRGHGYLCMFGLVEEFILPYVLDHARPDLSGDDYRVRALLQFASEEAKHIHLFKCFREAFEEGFGTRCEVIGPPEAIAREVLRHDPLAVALVILHIEWMTQGHYIAGVKADEDLDPQFMSLLRHHWMEEAQHAKLDTLMVETIAEAYDADAIAKAFAEYLEIGMFLDGGLRQQVDLDIDSFERATGRRLDAGEREAFVSVQHQAQRWTFIGSGMTHASFRATLARLSSDAAARLDEISRGFI